MITINKIRSCSAIDYAAEELKKYLRMMMPEAGDIRISYDPYALDGFRLGLMQDFGLDVSDAEDPELDDVLYVKCDEGGGVIAGSNPRSVLLAVYEYLRQNGCRWLFPGVDGEYIPMKDKEPVEFRHKPSMRYRGWCNEGAEFQQCMLDSIDFAPKVGMNVYMMEFRTPTVYYKRYYDHEFNAENYPPEPISSGNVIQWKRQCEAEIAKRGLQFHDIGHGFTVDSFGIDSEHCWSEIDESKVVPESSRRFLAQIGGKRGLFRGRPGNTNFCMSNPEARARVARYVAEYSEKHSNIDYLHVWLADSYNNHCECDECRKKIPSDWYMMLMNEIDEELEKKGLETRIVFIVYVDTTWPPLTERIRNPRRFSILFAPISRSYTESLPKPIEEFEIKPFVLNKLTLPGSFGEYLRYFAEWRKFWHGAAFAYEYHFWWHLISDMGGTELARRICEDIEVYKKHELGGIVQDGTQRPFFPTGLVFYSYARKLYDISLSPMDIAKEYLECAFGKDWKSFYDYLEQISALFGFNYMDGKGSSDPQIGVFYNPEVAARLANAESVFEKGEALIKSHYNSDYRVRTVSVRLLEAHLEYAKGMATVMYSKALGDDDEAGRRLEELRVSFGKKEGAIRTYYDHHLFIKRINSIVNGHRSNKKVDPTQI